VNARVLPGPTPQKRLPALEGGRSASFSADRLRPWYTALFAVPLGRIPGRNPRAWATECSLRDAKLAFPPIQRRPRAKHRISPRPVAEFLGTSLHGFRDSNCRFAVPRAEASVETGKCQRGRARARTLLPCCTFRPCCPAMERRRGTRFIHRIISLLYIRAVSPITKGREVIVRRGCHRIVPVFQCGTTRKPLKRAQL